MGSGALLSLFAILGAAGLALVCDYLRHRNHELKTAMAVMQSGRPESSAAAPTPVPQRKAPERTFAHASASLQTPAQEQPEPVAEAESESEPSSDVEIPSVEKHSRRPRRRRPAVTSPQTGEILAERSAFIERAKSVASDIDTRKKESVPLPCGDLLPLRAMEAKSAAADVRKSEVAPILQHLQEMSSDRAMKDWLSRRAAARMALQPAPAPARVAAAEPTQIAEAAAPLAATAPTRYAEAPAPFAATAPVRFVEPPAPIAATAPVRYAEPPAPLAATAPVRYAEAAAPLAATAPVRFVEPPAQVPTTHLAAPAAKPFVPVPALATTPNRVIESPAQLATAPTRITETRAQHTPVTSAAIPPPAAPTAPLALDHKLWVAPLQDEKKLQLVTRKETAACTCGIQDAAAFNRLLANWQPYNGLVICIGVKDIAERVIEKTVSTLLMDMALPGETLFRSSQDEFVLLSPNDKVSDSRRRLSAISHQLWDYQLRNLSNFSVLFSWGSEEAWRSPLSHAVEAARDNMALTNKSRGQASAGRRKVV